MLVKALSHYTVWGNGLYWVVTLKNEAPGESDRIFLSKDAALKAQDKLVLDFLLSKSGKTRLSRKQIAKIMERIQNNVSTR